ncbi:TetR/AcrR family transcriptional regulator [Nocardia thraciensis]
MNVAKPAKPRRSTDDLMSACRAAAIAEVCEVGLGRLTIESVARRAGTAKTSVYRYWTTAEELLLDALAHAHPVEVPAPAGGRLREDLLRSLEQLNAWLSSKAGAAAAAVIAERSRRPELVAALYERVFDPRGGRFTRTVLEHYARLGDIDERLLSPVVVDIAEALVIKHHIDTGQLPDRRTREAIVDQALLPALGLPRTKEESSS